MINGSKPQWATNLSLMFNLKNSRNEQKRRHSCVGLITNTM